VDAKTLRFYFDFYCPYSYIGWSILERQLQKKNIPLEFLAIGPNPPANKLLLGRKLWSDVRWEAISEHGKSEGLIVHKPASTAMNVFPHRGLPFYEGVGVVEYISGIFKGIFALRLDFSTTRQIQTHLQSEGIDSLPYNNACEVPNTQEQAEEKFLLWGERRIRTLPTLEFGQDRIAGVFDPRGVENFISISFG